jgi:hypothetical protein
MLKKRIRILPIREEAFWRLILSRRLPKAGRSGSTRVGK